MIARNDSILNMLRTVYKLYKQEQPRFDVLAAITALMVIFKAKLDSLEPWLTIILSDPTVDAKIVEEKKEALAIAAAAVATPTAAYASVTDNVALENTMKIVFSTLNKKKKDQLPTIVQTIYDEADAVKVAAASYGLTTAKLDALEAAIDAYKAVVNKPRLAHGEVTNANKQFNIIKKDMEKMLKKQLDRMVSTFATSDSSLVNLYKTARTIVDPGTNHTTFTILVKNAEGVFIEGATCLMDKLAQQKTLVTNASGSAKLLKISAGTWLVSVTAPGYLPYPPTEFKVVIKEDNTLTVVLLPIPTENPD